MNRITIPIDDLGYAARLVECNEAVAECMGLPPIEKAQDYEDAAEILAHPHRWSTSALRGWAAQPARAVRFPRLNRLLGEARRAGRYPIWVEVMLHLYHSPTYRRVVYCRARPYMKLIMNTGGRTKQECVEQVYQWVLPLAHRSVIGRAAEMWQRCNDEPRDPRSWLYRLLHEIGSNIGRTIRSELGLNPKAQAQPVPTAAEIAPDPPPPSRPPIVYNAELPEGETRDEDGPHARAEVEERNRLLRDAITALPEPERRVFLRVHEEGMTQEAIAEVMDLSIKEIKALIQRAKCFLRQWLRDRDHG